MRRNTKPYWIKRITTLCNRWYLEHFIRPQFDAAGKYVEIAHPRHLELFGRKIRIGDHAHIIAATDNKIRLTTWSGKQGQGEITIGNYCLISPGVRISAARSVHIGDNCMLAANVYVSDSDWHHVYNRIRPFRCTKPVALEDNVWLGESVMVLKGVTIGENSVIGAGSVVTKDIPANVVAAGNPARVIKKINPQRRMLKRELMFRDAQHYYRNQDELDRYMLANNGWLNWLRSVFFPNRND